jgi:hypothetical protein
MTIKLLILLSVCVPASNISLGLAILIELFVIFLPSSALKYVTTTSSRFSIHNSRTSQ